MGKIIRKRLGIILVFAIVFNSVLFLTPKVTYADSINYKLIKPNARISPDIVNNDFETGVEGWQVGSNAAAVQQAATTVNEPYVAYHGTYMLEMESTVCPGTSWRTTYKEFSTPLDLSKTPYFETVLNTYGINSANPYFEAKITFYSGSNSITTTIGIEANKWNQIFVNLSDWQYKASVDKIEISFRSTTFTSNWHAYYQIDYVGFTASESWQFEADGDYEGWTSYNNMSNTAVSGGLLEANITGTDPFIYGPSAITVDSAYTKYLTVKLKNNTSGTKAKIYWITNQDTAFNEAKSFEFDIVSNDNTYRTYGVDLSGCAVWDDIITRIRLDLPQNGNGTGDISVDSISLSTVPDDVYYNGEVDEIEATSTNIVVNGYIDCSSQKQVQLIELAPYEEYNFFTQYTPLSTSNITPVNGVAEFEFNVNRYVNSKDRGYSKFVVVVNDTVRKKVSVEKYVAIFPDAINNYDYPQVESIKGLQVQLIDDAQKLGVNHAAVNYYLDSMFLNDNSDPGNTLLYTMDGETFYINKGNMEATDNTIKNLSDNGTLVYMIILLSPGADTNLPAGKYLLHPDNTGGYIAAVNTTDEMGVKYWKCAMEFLAERYSRTDQQYGRAVNFIIGNEIDTAGCWNEMGSKSFCDYVDQYSRLLRIANTATVKKYSNARVYISLTHNWNIISTPDWENYNGKEIIDQLNAGSKEQGDFSWNIAYHPYPENLGDPKFWEDTTATESYYTQRINFKNLHILSDYMNQAGYLFNGLQRRIVLSEEGFHSYDNSTSNQQLQAAAYAYAYYIAKFTDGIDAFILHRHVNHANEGGLQLGLRLRDTTKSYPCAPGDPKYIYDVFRRIDTSESLAATDFAKAIIGINDWSDVISGFDSSKLSDAELPQTYTISSLSSITPTAYVSNFESDTDNWNICDYSYQAGRVSSESNSPGTAYNGTYMLTISPNPTEETGGAKAEKGIYRVFSTPINVTSTPKLQLAINSYGGCPNATAYYATIRVYSGTHIAEGKLQITPDQWNKLSIDLSNWGYKDSIDKVKIWFSTDSTYLWGGKFQVDYIGFSN